MKAIIKERFKNATDKTRMDLQETRGWMFNVGAIWTIFFLLMIIAEFLQLKFYDDHTVIVTTEIVKLYLAFLTAYSTATGVYNWYNPEMNKKPGEIFVIAWWILGVIMAIAHAITGRALPGQFETLLLGVLGIFVGKKITMRVATHIKEKIVAKKH